MRKLSVIIPAAGSGRRMRSFGARPLMEVARGETLLARQARIIKSVYPNAEVIAVLGYECDRVARSLSRGHVKIIENENYEETSVVRSIHLGMRVASNPNVMIVYGDLVFNSRAIEGLCKTVSKALVDDYGRIESNSVGMTVDKHLVVNFDFGLEDKWAQIAYLTGKELDLFYKFVSDPAKRRHLGFEALNYVIESGGRIRAVKPDGMKAVGLDSYKDIAIAKKVL